MRTPASTYRLQISEDFDLVAAARTLGYLHELGIDWVYLSPLLAATSGSSHGYDVVDHRGVDQARGGSAGLSALSTEARRLGMGVLVDVVPNHVGVARGWENEWWWHVLTHGAGSPYAGAFDIDWAAGGGRLQLPVVADADLAGEGRIEHLTVLGGELHYRGQRFPLAPGTAYGDEDDPNAVHGRQHYELVSWRQADRALNYRRFFAVNTLAAIRVEEPEWFVRSHGEIRRWFEEGLVDGLRVDHPDGLREPGRYLDDLAELTNGAYVVVEKILGLRALGDGGAQLEELPSGWPTAGTTGYDVMALVDRVLVDPAGEVPLTGLAARLHGQDVDWPALVRERKLAVANGMLHSEVLRISRELLGVLGDGAGRPGLDRVASAVAELLADFEVYRSYLPEGREYLDRAFGAAWEHRPDLGEVLDLIQPILSDGASDPARRFQQTSGMVMAKGVEDCAFYRWSRLTSLNEVGGEPSVFAVSPSAFHELMAVRQELSPAAQTAGTTHDTKRGEDVRARISVLAEVPQLWSEALAELLELVPVPDQGMANLLWQAVVGSWPADRQRLRGYAEKAMREAAEHTTWEAPDAGFEDAMCAIVDAAFDSAAVRAVLDRVLAAVVAPGWSNSLAAKLLDLTLPGVPDVYQGSELWELSLVDPDNRRPVDFARRSQLLGEVRSGTRPPRPVDVDDPGTAKQLLCHVALATRREHPEWFTGYQPLAAVGPAVDHVLAFDRGGAVSVATRLPVGLAAAGGWRGTMLPLPEGRWLDLMTGREVAVDPAGAARLADLLADYPVALLVRQERLRGARGRFDIWAPLPQRVQLLAGDRVVPMAREADGWWHPVEPEPLGRVDYGYLVDDDPVPLPDPRSRWQPYGVHGRSRTADAAGFNWQDQDWAGRQLAGSLIYELHVGTFTPEGTLDAAIGRLPHLVDLGVDFVEVMPVNAFNGTFGWGYEGVAWFAVHDAYGGPDAYRRFVNAAHRLGLAVVQDVVYNHFGPSGNYLPRFGPYLREVDTGWGAALNLDGPGHEEVRAYIADNVAFWFKEMHVDALRLDAVHALVDASPNNLLAQLAGLTEQLSVHLRRPLSLIAESEANDPKLVQAREAGGLGLAAQWSDDFHHGLRVALTGESRGYFADFTSLASLAGAIERGFYRDGTFPTHDQSWRGHRTDPETLPGWRLVVGYSNHDQIGNRAAGDRLGHQLDDDQLAAAAVLTLTAPFTPMLFQGEEWAASSPFPFFTSPPEADLARDITEGRLAEFEEMSWDPKDVAPPVDPATFAAAKLDWAELDQPRHAAIWAMHRELVALRREFPELSNPSLPSTSCSYDDQARWFLMRRGGIAVVVNFSDRLVRVDLGGRHRLRWASPAGARMVGTLVLLPPHAAAVLLPLA